MTNWNISASADAANVDGLPSGVSNDLGTIRQGGNIADTANWQSDSISLGSSLVTTIVSGVEGITGVLGQGTFNGGTQVIRKVTTALAGVANTTLQTGGSDSANRDSSINKMTAISSNQYKTAVRTGGWNEFSGVFSPAISTTGLGGWDIQAGADDSADLSATDHAANPSPAVPGQLAYRDGSPLPTTGNYEAQTSW
jgi:hypothetical protein